MLSSTCKLMHCWQLPFCPPFKFIHVFISQRDCIDCHVPFLFRQQRQSRSLFNWPALGGVLHKAAASAAGVRVSGVGAKFSKSSQCVSQWRHMLESLQRTARMHKLTCKWTRLLGGLQSCRQVAASDTLSWRCMCTRGVDLYPVQCNQRE